MAGTKVGPRLTPAEVDPRYAAMGEAPTGVASDDDSDDDGEARALAVENAGKFGRPFGYSKAKISQLATLRMLTGAGLRRVQDMSNKLYGEKSTPNYTTLCRRINAAGEDLPPGVAVLCDYGRTLILAVDGAGAGMTRASGWRQEKHSKERGRLLEHVVAEEGTGRFIASKITAPEGGAPQFEDLVETSLRNSDMDPAERREEARRRRADLAAGKAIVLSRSDKIADTSPEEAARVAESVERMLARGGGRESGGAAGAGAGRKGGGDAPKSAATVPVTARRYDADMDKAAAPILAAAAAAA